MHACQSARLAGCKLAEHFAGVLRVRKVVHLRSHRLTWTEDVAVDHGHVFGAGLSEEIATKECAGILLEQIATVPAMGQVRRVKPANAVLAQRKNLTVCHSSRLSVGKIVDRDHLGDVSAQRLRVRCHLEELIDATALIRLEVREAEVAQAGGWDHREWQSGW